MGVSASGFIAAHSAVMIRWEFDAAKGGSCFALPINIGRCARYELPTFSFAATGTTDEWVRLSLRHCDADRGLQDQAVLDFGMAHCFILKLFGGRCHGRTR